MISPINQFIYNTFSPPVMEARNWVKNTKLPNKFELMNLSQAAPIDLPPLAIRQAIANAALNEAQAHLYGPVLGNDDLRLELSQNWQKTYGGKIKANNIGITSGCNQAFCATIATIASPHDNVIIPSPWYFNHKMWLDMAAIKTSVLPVDEDMLPSIDDAEKLINNSTKAILLVTPNNPTGVEYPKELILGFYKIAEKHGISLIIDETYKDFHSNDGAPHNLFTEPNWENTLISLYSFSKAYRLTGHRVGAIIAGSARLNQIEKFLDTVTICPNQLGQIGALYGLQNLSDWLARERLEILSRKNAMEVGFMDLTNWKLKGCGAYFAYVEYPFDVPSDTLCKQLLSSKAILTLPEMMFTPKNTDNSDNFEKRHIRIAFANINAVEIKEMFERLKYFVIS
jgi:aspartate/methionine/tyrosine aminotransferase